MLRLALLRHAKSSWDDSNLDDFDRPLNARGLQAAPVMGAMLASLNFSPDFILCSPAERTRQTLKCIEPTFRNSKPRVLFDKDLYLASAADLLAQLRRVEPEHTSVLMIGHNPGMHALAKKLAVTGDPNQIARLDAKFPTASLAVYAFLQPDWQSLDTTTGSLEAFITPKDRA